MNIKIQECPNNEFNKKQWGSMRKGNTVLTHNFSQRSIFKNVRAYMHLNLNDDKRWKISIKWEFDYNIIATDFSETDADSSSHRVSHPIKISLSDKYD